MKSRREFLKKAATGAVLLGSQRKLGLAEAWKSTPVPVNRKWSLREIRRCTAKMEQLDEKRVLDLLDRAIAAYTGRDHPVEAWKHIVAMAAARAKSSASRRTAWAARESPPIWRWCWPSRAVAAGRRQARQHSGVGPQRPRSRGVRA